MQKESDYRTNSRVQGPSLPEWPSRGDGERITTPVTGEKFRFLFLFGTERLTTEEGTHYKRAPFGVRFERPAPGGFVLTGKPEGMELLPVCRPSGSCARTSYFRTEHEKFAESSVLPVPLYVATCG
jgi:hypothetical protein